jgi:hypothetical protein
MPVGSAARSTSQCLNGIVPNLNEFTSRLFQNRRFAWLLFSVTSLLAHLRLEGVRLEEARSLADRNDIVVRDTDGMDVLRRGTTTHRSGRGTGLRSSVSPAMLRSSIRPSRSGATSNPRSSERTRASEQAMAR